MKYFLDTNIVLILFQGRKNEIRDNVREILKASDNTFYASTISLLEIAQLYRKKKIEGIDYQHEDYNTGEKLMNQILKQIPMVKILPFEQRHAFIAGRLEFVPKHNDPNDLAIIAHAIAEHMPIISCDDKFPDYQPQGATVIHNPR